MRSARHGPTGRSHGQLGNDRRARPRGIPTRSDRSRRFWIVRAPRTSAIPRILWCGRPTAVGRVLPDDAGSRNHSNLDRCPVRKARERCREKSARNASASSQPPAINGKFVPANLSTTALWWRSTSGVCLWPLLGVAKRCSRQRLLFRATPWTFRFRSRPKQRGGPTLPSPCLQRYQTAPTYADGMSLAARCRYFLARLPTSWT